MTEAEFDRYAEDYAVLHAASVAVSGEGPEYFAEYKIRDIARSMRGYERAAGGGFPEELQVCDFGAGIGGLVPYVHKYLPGAQLTCVDVSRRSLELAEKRFPSQARFVHFDGARLPLPSDQFDIAFAACVFHHVGVGSHAALLQELLRILRPGGRIFVFEHNPWNPVTVRVVDRCPFDENATMISSPAMRRRLAEAGFRRIAVRYRIFFPHALRLLRPLERALAWMPLGAQYCAMAWK